MATEKDQNLLDRIYDLRRLRQNYEPMFYLSRKAYEGKHFVVWSREQQAITELPIKDSMLNQLPEISKQVDSYENFLLSTDFTFTVVPTKLSDDKALDESIGLSLLARNYYDRFRDSSLAADYIHNALLDNVSFVEVAPNSAKTDVEYRVYDGFDILFNPRIKDWDRQTMVVKVVRKTISEIADSKLYQNKDNVQSVGSGYFFSWKDVFEAEKYSSITALGKDEVLLFECYFPSEKGLRIKTLDGQAKVLRNDFYENVKGIPVIPLRIYSGEWYQPSFAYRLIPMNRSIDTISNRMESLILRLAKGGWILQEEETINGQMNEEMGQVIRYSATKPDQIDMPAIPNFLMGWFNGMLGLSERYGVSSVLSGNMPMQSSGLRASGMLDRLEGQAIRSNTAPINSLRAATKKILEYTFAYLYEMWETPQDVLHENFFDTNPRFVSEKYAEFIQDQENIISIPASFKKFSVDIDDALGYTLEARKKTAVELNKLGVISGETLKRIFKLGSSAYLVEADEKPMYKSKEFQQLLKAFPTMSTEQKQSVINVLQTLAAQQGNDPKMTGGIDVMAADTSEVEGLETESDSLVNKSVQDLTGA